MCEIEQINIRDVLENCKESKNKDLSSTCRIGSDLKIHSRPVPDEEKFGYLLEIVAPKVREKISNLKPGTLGYKTTWERLQKEYRQTKLVVNAHMDEIIYLTPVKGNSFEKVREFYEVLSKNYALQTLGEADMLRGFVMTTLKK